MREVPVRCFAKINAVQNVRMGAVPAAGGVIDMDAENTGKRGVAFHLSDNRTGDPCRLRPALPRGIIIERTIFDGHQN